jgi:peptide-methionine (S)-S-oxide reductase
MVRKIALGGGCHWCTEAVFQSLIGVFAVEQGFVTSTGENTAFSEAVIIHFDSDKITLKTLIEVHLHTHKSTSNHTMRRKYRSAIYVFSEFQKRESQEFLKVFQKEFEERLITQVLTFHTFKASREQIQNYYYSNPDKPFCQRFIHPKLELLLKKFSRHTNKNKLKHLQNEPYKAEY